VRLPWLDINARLQVAANHHAHDPQKGRNAGKEGKPIFSLPGFNLRSKKGRQQKHSDHSGNGNGNGNRNGNGNGKENSAAAGSSDIATALDNELFGTGGLGGGGSNGGGSNGGGNGIGNGDKPLSAEDWQDLTVPKKKKVWQSWTGLSVMAVGVVIPCALMLMTVGSLPKRLTLVVLNHPLEALAEILLTASIPIANYIVWSAICKNNLKFSLARGISLGAAAGSSLMIAAICMAAIFAGQQDLNPELGMGFNAGLSWLALLFAASAAVSVFLANKVRLTRDFARSRMQVLIFTIIGALLSVFTYISAEARPFAIRIAEREATSKKPEERMVGMEKLRSLYPERELLMECSDSRAAGLPGLFIPLKASAQHELYFALTGKPFSFKDITNTDLTMMPDEYLSLHVVGDKVPGLSMLRSYMTGILHSDTLSSTIDWTFVFKNETSRDQEVRSEISLPPGAVVTGLKLWTKGEPEKAVFSAIGSKHAVSEAASTDSPAWVVDLGHNRVLLHCYPVSQTEETECSITVVMPMNPDGSNKATVSMPRFIATNFDMSGEHQVRLRSDSQLSCSGDCLKAGFSQTHQRTLTGELTGDQLEKTGLLITANRPSENKPIAILDKMAVSLKYHEDVFRAKELERRKLRSPKQSLMVPNQLIVMIDGSKGVQRQLEEMTHALTPKTKSHKAQPIKIKVVKPLYVVQKLEHISAPAPKSLVVVVDGSLTMNKYAQELSGALKSLPGNVPTSIIVASDDAKRLEAIKLDRNADQLSKVKFVGGQDNLRAVVKASELAGETKGGAVLWIHGPQPIFNEEKYIMPPYVAAPQFYDLPLGSGETDTFDFFKNHSEIGPFAQVPRNASSVGRDLTAFFSKWQPNTDGYAVKLSLTETKPKDAVVPSLEQAQELLTLQANDVVKDLISKRHIRRATNTSMAYGLVTPVCSTLIQHEETYQNVEEPIANEQAAAASPQPADAMYANTRATAFEAPASDGVPRLQGATNGSIGPQGSDATYVTGVNTAGTVRVNNLANLEALLNILANLCEAGFGLIGVVVLLNSLVSKTMVLEMFGQELEISRAARVAAGIGLIIMGLAFPGVINWFVASARDANLFS